MKKIVFLFFLLSFFFLFPPGTNAQTQTVEPQQKAAYPLNTNPDVPNNFHTYTQNVFIEILSTATCFIGGVDLLNPTQKCLGVDPVSKKIGFVENKGGLFAIAGSLIGSTYNIPISTSQYGHMLASNFGITHNTYAASTPLQDGGSDSSSTKTGFGKGIGFVGLSPVMEIWKTFRNLTYLLFVFIFILLGLGIMFRVNIDARTVMTIQNQIPKIIIGLVLITLSYAIAGFLIDMMYVAIYLAIHVFSSQGLTAMTNIDTNPIMAIGPLGGINGIAAPAAQGVGGMISSLFTGTIGNFIGMAVGGIIGTFIGGSLFQGIPGAGIIGGLIGGVIGGLGGSKLLGLIAMVIAYLIISVAILSALFRVWFMLIKAYLYIFLDVIFAPFWIIAGLLPGAPGGVGPWFRSLIANLAGFPTVIILFMIGKAIQDQAVATSGNFIPPLIGNPGSNPGEAIASILGLGIILIMPEAVTMTKATLKAPELKYTAAIGRALGTGSGTLGKPIGGIKNELFGKDAFGAPKEGSLWMQRKFGKMGRIFTGGGIKDKKNDDGSDITGKSGIPLVKSLNPFSRGRKLTDANGTFRERKIFGMQSKRTKTYYTDQQTKQANEHASLAEAEVKAKEFSEAEERRKQAEANEVARQQFEEKKDGGNGNENG